MTSLLNCISEMFDLKFENAVRYLHEQKQNRSTHFSFPFFYKFRMNCSPFDPIPSLQAPPFYFYAHIHYSSIYIHTYIFLHVYAHPIHWYVHRNSSHTHTHEEEGMGTDQIRHFDQHKRFRKPPPSLSLCMYTLPPIFFFFFLFVCVCAVHVRVPEH